MLSHISPKAQKGVELIWYQQDSRQYAKGLQLLKSAVEEGDIEACYFLARCYAWGDAGCPKDEEKARELYQKGCSGGSVYSILGAARDDRWEEVLSDLPMTWQEAYNTVLSWAKEGDSFACYIIGGTLYWGEYAIHHDDGTPLEFENILRETSIQALDWFEKAANQGLRMALYNLVNGYGGAHDIPPDPERRMYWIQRGCELGIAKFMVDMGIYYEQEENWEKALYYYKRAFDTSSHPSAAFDLGLVYLKEQTPCYHPEEAFRMFQYAAEKGHLSSIFQLGLCYWDGKGTNSDPKKAFYWFDQGAQKGNINAIFYVARCYIMGRGCKQDYQQAKKLLELVIQKNPSLYEAYYEMGNLYLNGWGVPESYDKAAENYQIAARGGYAPAQRVLTHFKKNFWGKWKLVSSWEE